MNTKELLLGSLLVGAGLALTRKFFAATSPSGPARDNACYDAVDAYVE